MQAIYRDAYLVIAASNASSDNDGFLYMRTQNIAHIETKSTSQELADFFLEPFDQWTIWHKGTGDLPLDPVRREPLANRAWALQERYLARRTVHYGRFQIYWECASLTAAENGDEATGSRYRIGNLVWPIKAAPQDPTYRIYRGWNSIIGKYTSCGISFEKDIFPAFSGVARAVAQITKHKYCAGIWLEDLSRCLSWKDSSDPPSVPLEKPVDWPANSTIGPDWDSWKEPRTPTEYLAPSFSWASLGKDFTIIYNSFDMKNQFDTGFEALCDYLDHHLDYSTSDTYGPLRGGWLKVSAPILRVDQFALQGPIRLSQSLKVSYKDWIYDVSGSFEKNVPNNSSLYILILAGFHEPIPDESTVVGIILRRRSRVFHKPFYERVGWFNDTLAKSNDYRNGIVATLS